jgi:hypothetical protein
MGNCIYTQHQILISKSIHKQPESDTQNNEYSLHMIIGRSKTKTTQILRKDSSPQLPHITTITTTVEQPTTHIRICSGHKVLNETYNISYKYLTCHFNSNFNFNCNFYPLNVKF